MPAVPSPCLQLDDAVALLVPWSRGTPSDDMLADLLRAQTGRADVRLRRRPSGRPALERPYPELGVSIAKRDGLTIVGFSPTQIVGVDIEIDQPEIDIDMLMRDHFAPGEGAALQRLPPADRRLVFFRLWTLKEAALKISGRGVFDGVSQPDLSATGAMSAALASGTGRVFCDGRPIHLAWTVLPGCHAALAIADAAA